MQKTIVETKRKAVAVSFPGTPISTHSVASSLTFYESSIISSLLVS